MSKDFLFIAGDIGAARMQAPVIRTLRNRGHRVSVIADARGAAGSGFDQEGIAHMRADPAGIEDVVLGHDLAVIGTSASAQRLEWAAWNAPGGRKVLAADGYFNHGLAPWRDVRQGTWLAIDEGHAQAIREQHPGLDLDDLKVTGQPAFDAALALVPRKREIRARVRASLGFEAMDTVHVWWSQGMPRVIEEDFLFLREALAHPQAELPVLIPRFHPKLDALRPGLVDETRRLVEGLARDGGFRVVDAGRASGEEICLAADVILSITCTEDIKSTLIGGPPVVHFMGPEVRAWFEEDLGLRPPYLPDVATGTAEAALTPAEVPRAIARALRKAPLRTVNPQDVEPATDRVVEALLDIAS